ncbi:phage baseplate assembly protein V [Hymenobacter sp. HD11105]
MSTEDHRYLGKYRGVVVNNQDPENRGRIQARVPDVQGMLPTTYALPCLPAAGKGSGTFFLPELNSAVWIEFEQGNPDYPIWTGCFWGSPQDLPETAQNSPPATPNIVLQTNGPNSITVFGKPDGGITLCAGPLNSSTSPRITITPNGITLSAGAGLAEIKLSGPTVTINGDALKIT